MPADLSSKKSNAITNVKNAATAFIDAWVALSDKVVDYNNLNTVSLFVDADFIGDNKHIDLAAMTAALASITAIGAVVNGANRAALTRLEQ